jgi:hypothetical protein
MVKAANKQRPALTSKPETLVILINSPPVLHKKTAAKT